MEAAAINNISYLVDGKEIYSDASLYIVEAGAELEAYTSNGTSVLTALGNHVVSVVVNGNINNTGSLIVEGKGGPDGGGDNTYTDLKDYFKQNVFNVVGSGYTYIDFNGDLAKAFEVWLKAK
ncbi:hypothetical protein, partial [Ruminiclostridium hungatei]|uniref:hypothetical protein n=1 Tax=Ruminiclostridium hungatei TaxID=48256 RepID=UPI0010550CAA